MERHCNKFEIQLTQVNFDLSVAQHKRVVIISAYITVLRNNVHSCNALLPNSKPLSVPELIMVCLSALISDLYQVFCSFFLTFRVTILTFRVCCINNLHYDCSAAHKYNKQMCKSLYSCCNCLMYWCTTTGRHQIQTLVCSYKVSEKSLF